jgi:hypothetical protein
MLPARRPIPVGHNRHRSKVILFFEGVDRARSQVAGGECVRTSSRNFERSSDRRMAGFGPPGFLDLLFFSSHSLGGRGAGECAGMVSGAGAGTHDWGGAVQRRKKKGELCSVLFCSVVFGSSRYSEGKKNTPN